MVKNQRQLLIKEFWDRSKELSVKNKGYRNFLEKFFYFLLNEDIGKRDITTDSLIKKNEKISAVVVAKEDGIFAGAEEFAFLNKDLKINQLKGDGDEIKNGDKLINVLGNATKILEKERASLNLLQRMSGIATLTNNLVKKLNDKSRIAATRKTLWGLIDKKAVSIGGGLTHRLNLSDGILIKDNHLKIMGGDIEKALGLAKSKSRYFVTIAPKPSLRGFLTLVRKPSWRGIEIEVENKKQAIAAAKVIKKLNNSNNLFAIMPDKIPPKEIKLIVEELKNQDLYDCVLLEASGDINPDNLIKYKDCSVDIISMGYITNSAKVLNMSMEIIK